MVKFDFSGTVLNLSQEVVVVFHAFRCKQSGMENNGTSWNFYVCKFVL